MSACSSASYSSSASSSASSSSTATMCECSLPDLNRDHLRPVFPAGPQPRSSAANVPYRTSTATNVKRYARQNAGKRSEDVPQKMSEDMAERVSNRMSEDVPERVSDRMSEDVPERLSEKMSEDMPERMSEDMPERTSERISEDMPERKSEDWPERMSERKSEKMPERLSEDVPERIQKECQKVCQKSCQKICQKECQEICKTGCQKIFKKECHTNKYRYTRATNQNNLFDPEVLTRVLLHITSLWNSVLLMGVVFKTPIIGILKIRSFMNRFYHLVFPFFISTLKYYSEIISKCTYTQNHVFRFQHANLFLDQSFALAHTAETGPVALACESDIGIKTNIFDCAVIVTWTIKRGRWPLGFLLVIYGYIHAVFVQKE